MDTLSVQFDKSIDQEIKNYIKNRAILNKSVPKIYEELKQLYNHDDIPSLNDLNKCYNQYRESNLKIKEEFIEDNKMEDEAKRTMDALIVMAQRLRFFQEQAKNENKSITKEMLDLEQTHYEKMNQFKFDHESELKSITTKNEEIIQNFNQEISKLQSEITCLGILLKSEKEATSNFKQKYKKCKSIYQDHLNEKESIRAYFEKQIADIDNDNKILKQDNDELVEKLNQQANQYESKLNELQNKYNFVHNRNNEITKKFLEYEKITKNKIKNLETENKTIKDTNDSFQLYSNFDKDALKKEKEELAKEKEINKQIELDLRKLNIHIYDLNVKIKDNNHEIQSLKQENSLSKANVEIKEAKITKLESSIEKYKIQVSDLSKSIKEHEEKQLVYNELNKQKSLIEEKINSQNEVLKLEIIQKQSDVSNINHQHFNLIESSINSYINFIKVITDELNDKSASLSEYERLAKQFSSINERNKVIIFY